MHSVEKREILSLKKKTKYRQIHSSVTYLVKPLLSRNFCQKCVRENPVICTLCNVISSVTVWKLRKFTLALFWQKFRGTNVLTKEITKYAVSSFDEIFFSESKFLIFLHCDSVKRREIKGTSIT